MDCVKSLVVALTICAFPGAMNAQMLHGKATDPNMNALSDVRIAIPALERIAYTSGDGSYRLESLPAGTFLVEFSRIGYRKEAFEIALGTSDTRLDVVLTSAPLTFPVITVTAEPEPTTLLEVPLPVTVLEGQRLFERRGQSIGETMDGMPGVNGFSGGPLAVKPVIRGLTGQRIVVLDNGVRLEGQSWDEPQSPETDVMRAERIEVVRGPNSVLYGSDALGGVVNIIEPALPPPVPQTPLLAGAFGLQGFSNAPQRAGSLSLEGASSHFSYRAQFSGRIADDYSTPGGTTANGSIADAGEVFNSGAEEFHGAASVAMHEDWGRARLDISHFGQKYYIAPEPGRKEWELNINTGQYDSLPAAPSQEIMHEKAALSFMLPSSIARFDITGAFQMDSRREEGVEESEEDEQKKEELGIKPEAELTLNTLSLDAKAHHKPLGPVNGTLGVSMNYQANETGGQKAIVPGFTALNLAGFLYEEYRPLETLRLTGGARYDTRSLNADANEQLELEETQLDFEAVTATAGLSLEIAKPVTLAVNIGRGWRAPVAAELFFHGADEGEVRYKIGNRDLVPEVSLNTDISLRASASWVTAEVNVFRNSIKDFMYLYADGRRVEGLRVYIYAQGDATLEGGEFAFEMELLPWLVLEGGLDVVRGTFDADGSSIPRMPADRYKTGLRLQSKDALGIHGAYVALRTTYADKQDRVAAQEDETPAYFLLNIALGGTIRIGGLPVQADLSVHNALDRAYFDHLSRYKDFALNPGRTVALRASVPFVILN